MATARYVAIPEAKPAFELVEGRLCQKVSAQYNHGRVQFAMTAKMKDWARGRGRVSIEWRFYLDDPVPGRHSLVPDVAFVSYERLPKSESAAAQQPHLAPDVAVEILSPDDWRSQIDRKTLIYLLAGTELVLEIDPAARTLRARAHGLDRLYREGEVFAHPAMPGFMLDVGELFAELDD